MNDLAARLDSLDREAVAAALTRCCGARRWVEEMMARRPWQTDEALYAAAEEIWQGLEAKDWRQAFAHHPRIGDRSAAAAPAATRQWSRSEQSGAAGSSAAVQERLAELNLRYEERFGHVFLICASGRSGEEMVAELERRLQQEPAAELAEAAAEQAKITRLRLKKLATELPSTERGESP